MNNYYRMAVLAEMNESIGALGKGGEKFQKDMRNIQRHNYIQMLRTEKDEPRNEMLRVFKLAEKEVFKKHQKARLIDSRWLSDGSLECVFQCADGEIFTQNYSEKMNEDYEDGTRESSKAWNSKVEREKKFIEKTFNEFNSYFTGVKKTKQDTKLLELYS